jgi:hypothetical protein
VGNVAIGEALKRFDADGGNLMFVERRGIRKCSRTRPIKRRMEQSRLVAMSINGLKAIRRCARWMSTRGLSSNPHRGLRMVVYKFAHNAAPQVFEDLEQTHGRPCLKSTLQDLAADVGAIVQTKEQSCDYEVPDLGAKVGIHFAELNAVVETVRMALEYFNCNVV